MRTKRACLSLFLAVFLTYGFSILAITPFQAPKIAYVANACWYCFGTGADNGWISICDVNSDGSLATCSQFVDSSIFNPYDIVIDNTVDTAYIFNSTNPDNNSISICPVNTDGSLSTCTSTFSLPTEFAYGGLHPLGGKMYFVDTMGNNVYVCPINGDGTLNSCTELSDPTFNGPNGRIAMTPDGTIAYVANFNNGTVSICPILSDGTFDSCTASNAPDSNNNGTLLNTLGIDVDPTGAFAYVANSDFYSFLDISTCAISAIDGSLSNCTTRYDLSFGTLNYVNNLFACNNSFAYFPNDFASTIAICAMNTDGSLGTCTAASDSTFAFPESVWITNGK